MDYVKFINRDNLRIARENMGLDTATASKKISSSKRDLVSDWENDHSLPTWIHIEKLSKLYNVPELLFFSKDVIHKNKIIPDYRVGVDKEDDHQIKKLINLVETRQKWLEKNLKDSGFPKSNIQGAGINKTTPKDLALFIKEKLEINTEKIKVFSGVHGRRKTLSYLIEKAEAAGIFVGKTISYHRLKVEDMRGLFISNDYCPFIVLNRKDALSAQIFSLIHELAHVFRKSDAVSNTLDFRSTNQKINSEEVFCNKVAAELLLPEDELTAQFYNKFDIDNLSEIYKVSKIFIFYRLKELGKIRGQEQDDLEKEIEEETKRNLMLKAEKESRDKGGNYTNSMKDSNGNLFNRFVASSYSDNKIGYVEASNLLLFSAENV